MNSGKTNLCEVNYVKGKYVVTWNKHLTGLNVYSEKVNILIDIIAKESKSSEVGILLNTGHVLWLSFALLATVDSQVLAEYIRRCGQVKDHREIEGAIFDNTGDVDLFVDRLEKKYIVYLLKK